MNMRVAVGALSLAGLFAGLGLATWRRSGDAIIDFPRQAYTAWRLTEGDQLYRDIFCIYGPWPHAIEAVGFSIFGPGLDVILVSNLLVLVACCFLFYSVVNAAGGRKAAWIATACFIAIYGFNLTGPVGSNYNFITPYCSQATWGFLGLLLALRGLTGSSGWPSAIATGAGLALTLLNKPEFVLAGLACGGVAVACQCVARKNSDQGTTPHPFTISGVWLVRAATGAALVTAPLALWFAMRGGVGHAWEALTAVPNTVLNPAFRHGMSQSLFNKQVLGLDRIAENLTATILAGSIVLVVTCILGVANRTRPPGKGMSWAAGLLAAATTPWLSAKAAGLMLVLPVFVLAILSTKKALQSVRQQSVSASRETASALLAVAGAMMLLRMGLNASLHHYGFFMTPLALAALVAWAVPRRGWQGAVASGLVLGLAANTAYITFLAAKEKTLETGQGRDRFYSYPLHIFENGTLLEEALYQIAQLPVPPATILGIPESAAINYHTRTRNPTPAQEWNPDHLEVFGQDRLLENLRLQRPDAIVLFGRDFEQYGVRRFGDDERSGERILRWLLENYRPAIGRDWIPRAPTEQGIVTLVPREWDQGPKQ